MRYKYILLLYKYKTRSTSIIAYRIFPSLWPTHGLGPIWKEDQRRTERPRSGPPDVKPQRDPELDLKVPCDARTCWAVCDSIRSMFTNRTSG